ncbi:hypothetical protein DH2020_037245 [Rehmannia glutinosa]|uniref:Retrotransposon Copia-like N-terminal domain-containing protein n=1 Tax=Rehmannia glutinosa TaxID=99300 RepID=A0ABR0V3J2_REHGL
MAHSILFWLGAAHRVGPILLALLLDTSPLIIEDPTMPYFLPPSDNSHTIEIKPPLDGSNYTAWSRAFTLSISVKNKQGFLDGSIPTPDFSDQLYVPWLRCNNLILTWLFNSVNKDIASSIIYMNSAKEVWDTLKTRYSQPDSVRIFQLQQQLSSASQGSSSISDYFTSLNTIWEELRNYRPFPHCSCGLCSCQALKALNEIQLSDYTFKFLMGLNDSYESTRGQILLMNPIPSLDTLSMKCFFKRNAAEKPSFLFPPS